MNKSETATIAEAITKHGYEHTTNPADADIILIGTCIVIQHTENRMWRRIEELKKLHKPMVVSGCLSALKSNHHTELTWISPQQLNGHINVLGMSLDLNIIPPLSKPIAVPIAQGCLGNCSYCITKLARGILKSYPETEIVRKVQKAVNLGYKEIRITAQDTAVYGKDIGSSLPKLLTAILNIPGTFKIRLGMMEPKGAYEILDPLMNIYKNTKMFKFLHLPVQSGADQILNDMQRNYTVAEFKKIVERFRAIAPHTTLSTDIIVGYPTDTDETFEQSYQLIREIEPEILNITRYSPRPYTRAYSLKPILPRKVKQWSRALTALHSEIAEKANTQLVGTLQQVLVTEQGKRNFLGRTDGYRPVILTNVKLNKFYTVEIVSARNTYLIGKVV